MMNLQARPNTASHEDFPTLGAPLLPASGKSKGPIGPSSLSDQLKQASSSPATTGQYGLTGLLSVIKMTDQDLNALALGFDLTTLGLNLNSPDYLFTTFASPWSDGPTRVQPEYRIPQCYFMQPPHLRFQMFQIFQLETLFYIFYSMPQDILQLAAAQELYNRDWRYHKDLKCWITRAPETDLSVKTSTYEKGSYLYFDPEKSEKVRLDDYLLVYDVLEEKTNLNEHPAAASTASSSTTSAAGPSTSSLTGQSTPSASNQSSLTTSGVAPGSSSSSQPPSTSTTSSSA